MGLSLLLPLGLAALAALLIPLLLHLHRRQEQQATLFAALRWIRGPAKPRRRIQLEQWPLLLLRLVLLALLALLLAQPQWRGAATRDGEWVVVAPGVDAAQARAQLALPRAQWRWLLPQFPALDNAAHGAAEAQASASLLRELDSELAPSARLHVIVPGTLHGLDGGEIALSRAVDWQVIAQAPGALSALPAPRLRISLRGADVPARIYLQAAVKAWNQIEPERFPLTEEAPEAALDANTALVFWLAGEPSPALLRWVEAGGTALLDAPQLADAEVIARDSDAAPLLLAKAHGNGRLLSFSKPLDPAQLPLLLDATFPQTLRSALLPPQLVPDWAFAAHLPPREGAARGTPAARPLAPPLILLAALAFLAERALSLYYRRRRA
ncbi:BatA domain-containing protein [Tahibacter harae]|uniref:BatA domain-containing protein n=1 Tax=Tahibacter harae TaxID=2963937 RepID=A0ABT1QYI1_9GAMM|nr:BatA domain-containing protein [Tahibacter harae]MCQ4167342.1 BatA domain-containing protein [Tahibacter harae]